MSQTKKFYKSKKWKAKRLYILRRAEYRCQEAKRYGKYEEANTVHHIYPMDAYPELAYKDWNLISVSASRHNTLHDRETGRLTVEGIYWQNRRRKEFEEWKRMQSICMEQR